MSIIILLSRKSAKSNDIIDLHHPIGPNLSIRILCIITEMNTTWTHPIFSIVSALNLRAIKSFLLPDPIRYDIFYHHWEEHDLIWSKLVFTRVISGEQDLSDVHILFVQMHGFIKFYIISAIKLCTCLRSTGSMSRSALSFCPSISFTFFTLFSISSTSDGWFFMIWFFSTLRGKMSTIKPRSLSFESHLSLGIKLKVSYFFSVTQISFMVGLVWLVVFYWLFWNITLIECFFFFFFSLSFLFFALLMQF